MSQRDSVKLAAVIADAGGEIVGRTRLQKIIYLLGVTGFETGFSFSYKHYGPFSESVANAARSGQFLGDFRETEKVADWGGSYSIYESSVGAKPSKSSDGRRKFTETLAKANAVILELAATAVFLFKDGFDDPWGETKRRKPEKADDDGINRAKDLLRSLSKIKADKPLPDIF